MDELEAALEQKSPKRKKHNNAIKFINFMEFSESDTHVPFYVVYWYYRKWCEENSVKPSRRVTKHVLSRTIGNFFKKKSTYPKSKKYGVTIDYQMVVYVKSPYFPLDKEEQEIAFNYYHYFYDQERQSWKTKRKRKEQKDLNTNTPA